eukprot:gene9843-biopygen5181
MIPDDSESDNDTLHVQYLDSISLGSITAVRNRIPSRKAANATGIDSGRGGVRHANPPTTTEGPATPLHQYCASLGNLISPNVGWAQAAAQRGLGAGAGGPTWAGR